MIQCHLKAILREHNLSQKELCDMIERAELMKMYQKLTKQK